MYSTAQVEQTCCRSGNSRARCTYMQASDADQRLFWDFDDHSNHMKDDHTRLIVAIWRSVDPNDPFILADDRVASTLVARLPTGGGSSDRDTFIHIGLREAIPNPVGSRRLILLSVVKNRIAKRRVLWERSDPTAASYLHPDGTRWFEDTQRLPASVERALARLPDMDKKISNYPGRGCPLHGAKYGGDGIIFDPGRCRKIEGPVLQTQALSKTLPAIF